jgi:ABC-type lipoprotein release transport system permease subunit
MASRNLRRYPGKTVSVLIPLLLVMGTTAAVTFVRNGLLADAKLSYALLPDITVQRMVGGRVERIDCGIIDTIATMEHVKRVVPRVWGFLPVEQGKGEVVFTMMGIDLDASPVPEDFDISLEEGSFLDSRDPKSALVGQVFSSTRNLHAGDRIRIQDSLGNTDEFTVTGIFSSAVEIYSADLIMVSIDAARNFFRYDKDEATDFNVYLDNPVFTDAVAAKIAEYTELRVLTRDVLSKITEQAYSGRSGVFQILWIILLVTAFIIAWTQSSNISIDRKKEIGILRSLGWGIGDIIEMNLMESFLIGVFGTFGGFLLGLFYLHLGAPGIREYFLGWSTIYPEFSIPILIDGGSIFLLCAIGILPVLAATLIPSWLTGIIDPDEAIRR